MLQRYTRPCCRLTRCYERSARAFDALALLAAGIPRIVAIFGVQGWRWAWSMDVRTLIFALDTDAAGQELWRQLARQAALRGKQGARLPAVRAERTGGFEHHVGPV